MMTVYCKEAITSLVMDALAFMITSLCCTGFKIRNMLHNLGTVKHEAVI